MRLTKFVHACVLAEDQDKTILFDPGQFSWESGLFPFDSLKRLDYVAITHEHFDHFYEPFVKRLAGQFPQALFLSTEDVVARLHAMGINKAQATSTEDVDVAPLDHDSMQPLNPGPMAQNVRFHFRGTLTHPGDSIHLNESKDILFLPLAGPWESTIEAVRLADTLKPKTIVPIHDWMWNDQWRKNMYDRLQPFYAERGMKFVATVDGQPFEV